MSDTETQKKAAIEVLSSPEVAPICEMVVWNDVPDEYVARNSTGTIRFRRVAEDGAYRYEVIEVEGENFLEKQDQGMFTPLEAETSALYPTSAENHYPNAYETISQVFDDDNAPDMAAIHTAAHNWEDEGGHRGEHGSIDVVQARAPFIAGGKGIARLGMVDRGAKLIDIAPTVMHALGAPKIEGVSVTGETVSGLYLKRQDGEVIEGLIEEDNRPNHVVVFLMDGCNPNVLYDMAARGEAPNISRIMELGTTFRHGAIAGYPTVTLANHTATATGVYPGHHAVLNNSFWHRRQKKRIDTNHPATWHRWAEWRSTQVETIHEAIHRAFPGAFTASVDEPADGGADFSTFELFRKGKWRGMPQAIHELPHASEQFVRPHKDYEWSTAIDHMAVEQARGIWSGHFEGDDYGKPKFMWVNFTLTDTAMHKGGPHSEIAYAGVRDTDGRVGEVLAAIENAGVFDETAFIFFADHGMEESNPDVTGNWANNLREEGISFRDEGYGFIYIGVED